ncbi:MAG: hypothetical protein K0S58_2731 [Nitrospira sp.]|jgi:hypothetical protein|nr:hypothetical protein [Nitrospira sp.]
MPPVPIDIAIGFTFLPLAVAALLTIVFVRLSRSLWRIVAVMAGWAGLTAIMAHSGILAAFNSRLPWIPLLVLTQLAFVAWLAWFSSWSGLLAQIPQWVLVGLQSFRIPVELLLAALATRRLLAIEMTYYGRNYDVLAGVTAVFLSIWLRRQGEKSLRLVVVGWNLMGLSLVTIVLIHGLFSVPYPFQLLPLSVPTFVIATFPVVWLLTVLVPIAYLLHLVSLQRCVADRTTRPEPSNAAR